MRLINTSNYQLKVFSSVNAAPEYAILSHTWGADDDEVSLQEMAPGVELSPAALKFGFVKISKACQLAKKAGLDYVWVDTCCIDKSSSAELTESINSMFRWYQKAKICYAFLSDWDYTLDPTSKECRWWTRGWTLQELLASPEIEFYDKTWEMRGTKSSLRDEIAYITGIAREVLSGQTALSLVPAAVRMSWASNRKTTRQEDEAYCLLGIFDVNMPLIYGEDSKAFQRLQEEIIKTRADLSILGWRAAPSVCQEYMGFLAPSPREFAESKLYPTFSIFFEDGLDISSHEFLEAQMGVAFHQPSVGIVLPILHDDLQPGQLPGSYDISNRTIATYAVVLHPIARGTFVRANPDRLYKVAGHKPTLSSARLKLCKSLSAGQSNACSRRTITLNPPIPPTGPYFSLVKVDPDMLWLDKTKNLVKLYVLSRDHVIVRLHFKSEGSSEFSSFDVLCRFRNPLGQIFSSGYWECELAQLDGTQDVPERYYMEHDFSLSNSEEASVSMSKAFEIPQQNGGPLRKRVTLTLNREYDHRIEDVRFSVSILVT